MNGPCPETEDLLRLIDGELTENRATDLRGHLAQCASCAAHLEGQRALIERIAAPVPGLPAGDAVARLMSRLDDACPAARRPWVWRWPVAAVAATAAVLALVLIRPPSPTDEAVDFQPRGAAVDWSRKVGVDLWALEAPIRRVSEGESLAPQVALVASYSNADASPAHLLAFALDASGEVHWLYPAYVDALTDPEAVRLEPSTMQRAFPESVILDALPPGPVRFVFVVTRAPLHVSDVESLSPAQRAPEALRLRWPEARVDDLPAVVAPLLPPDHRGPTP